MFAKNEIFKRGNAHSPPVIATRSPTAVQRHVPILSVKTQSRAMPFPRRCSTHVRLICSLVQGGDTKGKILDKKETTTQLGVDEK